ncbi:MAG: hypothetical protein AAF573_15330, partial [Bacteroidota bacterium]
MQKILLPLLSLIPFFLFGQNGHIVALGGRSNAVANASVAFHDINSTLSNQAGLAKITQSGFVLASEQRFLLTELSSVGAGFALPTSSGTFGLSVQYFGSESYNESKIGLAYGRKLAENFSLGVQFDVLNTRIAENGSKLLYTFEVGLQYELIENVLIGIHIFNPVRLEIIEAHIGV